MEVYLPIVEVQINVILILFVSFIIGFLSGLFGVGGGFLMTPFLIFMGIPPAFAVANEANNILASSSSGALTHWFKKTLDVKMGWLIVIEFNNILLYIDLYGIYLMVLGGVCYTLGVIFYSLDKLKYSHTIWHLFVLGGSISHYFMILFYII